MIVFKIHSRCNLDCTYCYMYQHGDDSYLRKPKRVPWAVVEQVGVMIRSYCAKHETREFEISLHGGEPLLVGKEYMDRMLGFLRKQVPEVCLRYSLQTNASLVDDEWIEIFNRHRVSLCASIDGPEEVNALRVDHSGRSSWADSVRGIRLLREKCDEFAGTLTVVNPSANGGDVVAFLIGELGVRWFDLLLPDYSHDHLPEDFDEVQESLLRYMTDAFDEWFPRALDDGVQCRFFDNLLARLVGEDSHIDTIGQDGVSTISVETDGSLEPHDALRVCRGFERSTGVSAGAGALEQVRESAPYLSALQKTRQIPDPCLRCVEFDVCKGGHLIHRWSRESEFSNPSVHCAVLLGLITHAQTRLGELLLLPGSDRACRAGA